MKAEWKEYFVFSKKERNAVFVLLSTLLLLIIIPYFQSSPKVNISIDENLQQQLDALGQHQQKNLYNYNKNDTAPKNKNLAYTLFPFDPNTATEEDFKKLGLNEHVIKTLLNYRSKGGYFKKPDDIKKIYGLSNEDANRLIPYIKINSSKAISEPPKTNDFNKQNSVQPVKNLHSININTATAEDFIAFPGVGDVLGNRIIKFRNKIGGFKSIDEIRKTYGLPDSVFLKMKPYLYLDEEKKN